MLFRNRCLPRLLIIVRLCQDGHIVWEEWWIWESSAMPFALGWTSNREAHQSISVSYRRNPIFELAYYIKGSALPGGIHEEISWSFGLLDDAFFCVSGNAKRPALTQVEQYYLRITFSFKTVKVLSRLQWYAARVSTKELSLEEGADINEIRVEREAFKRSNT